MKKSTVYYLLEMILVKLRKKESTLYAVLNDSEKICPDIISALTEYEVKALELE